MKSITLIFIFSLALQITGLSQVTQDWVAIYTEGIARAWHIEADNWGNVIVSGQKGDDWLTIKYNANGDALWEKSVVSLNDPTLPNDMALDPWGNAIIVGATKDASWYYVWYALKYDATDGHVVWEDSIENNNSVYSDKALAVATDTLGRAVVVGAIKNGTLVGGTGFDWAAKCYTSSGVTHWFDQFDNDTTSDAATGVTVTKNGIAYVCGYTWDEETQNYLIRVRAYDDFGPDWVKYIPVITNSPTIKITHDSLHNVYVAADEASTYQDFGRIFIIKYDSLGNQVWETDFSTQNSFDDRVIDISLDSTGNLILACQYEDDDDFIHCQIVKFNTDGDSLWALDQGPVTWPKAMATDAEGNIYVAGKMENGIVTKFDPEGNELWSTFYNGPIYAHDMAMDKQQNIFVCGQSSSDFITIKYTQQLVNIPPGSSAQHSEIELYNNQPNPFSEETVISYKLHVKGFVELNVFNIHGKKIKNLVRQSQPAGMHKVTVDGNRLSPGIYYYQLRVGNHSQTKKMVIQR